MRQIAKTATTTQTTVIIAMYSTCKPVEGGGVGIDIVVVGMEVTGMEAEIGLNGSGGWTGRWNGAGGWTGRWNGAGGWTGRWNGAGGWTGGWTGRWNGAGACCNWHGGLNCRTTSWVGSEH